MKIEKIICKRGFTLTLKFDNGEILKADYTKQAAAWKKAANKAYRKLADPKAFQSCRIDDGDLVFPAVKIDGKTAYFDGASVYADCPKPKTRKPARKSCLSGIDGDTNTTIAATDPADIPGTVSAIDIINNTQLNGLPFTGEWRDFLGEPERNFYMILSAQPGHGKSIFCLKFANYLAKNFGKSIFITNEEYAALIKRKLQFIKDGISSNFDICFQAPTYAKIKELLQNSDYDFVFIDSAQASGVDAKELWELKQQFPQKALIVISRMTKDGKTRGSQNKEYDGDITINFTAPGIATTIKNRFGAVGREFQVF